MNIEKEIVGRTAVLMLTEDLPHDDAEARAINEIAVETKLGRRMALSRLRPPRPVAAGPFKADAEWVMKWLLAPVRLVTPRPPPDYVPPSQPPHTRRRRVNGPNPPAEPADQPATILGPLLYTSGDGVRTAIDLFPEFENDRRSAGRDEATRNHRAQNPR